MFPQVYIDIILPLRLPQLYTYAVSEEWADQLEVGKRVEVQFGKRRMYTALIERIHEEEPELHKPKEILSVIDDAPVITAQQLKLWKWIASYYMVSLGEVMQAALPAGLKLNSETIISLHPDWEEGPELTDNEFITLQALTDRDSLSLDEISKLLGLQRIQPVIESLYRKGAILAGEELVEKYVPKTISHVRLAIEEDQLDEAAEGLKRAKKQEQALMTFLHLKGEKEFITKKELMNEAGVSDAVIKGLADKGIIEIYQKEVTRLKKNEGKTYDAHSTLNPIQQEAKDNIEAQWDEHQVVLLHGVTSSGKTHIYIELIEEAIAKGKQALFLLPEIALTGQMVGRLRAVFGDQLGVYHSRFNDAERVEIWDKVLKNEFKVVLGARSAVWLPYQDLGLVVVDEEHDPSYKQFDPAPRYQARDSAIYLAQTFGAKVLLGTATPSLESWLNAKQDKYGFVQLLQRFGKGELPEIRIINMTEQLHKKQVYSHFSNILLDEIKASLDRKEQVILFQNKRGFAPYIMCHNCGWIPYCSNCDVSLTYHKYFNKLKCHYCGFQSEPINDCERCGHHAMQIVGFGTEQIEEELQQYFSDHVVARFDFDTTRTKTGYQRILERFHDGLIDILVGTQMVTKGLDFANVSLVGVLSADQILSFPDFRANERAYQLMEQVSGRAGRSKGGGQVLIQAMDPLRPVVQAVKQHNFKGFLKNELHERHEFNYPPYRRLIQLTLKHRDSAVARDAARLLASYLKPYLKGLLMGPTPPLIGRIKNQYLQDILLKIEKDGPTLRHTRDLIYKGLHRLELNARFKSVRVAINVDP